MVTHDNRYTRHVPEIRTFDEHALGTAALDRILVPLDGSVLAGRILSVVSRVLARREVDVTLLSVLPEGEEYFSEDNTVEAACDYLDWQKHRFAHLGANVRYKVAVGDPAQAILTCADECEPSLIAMATHGDTGIDRWRRGSVTEEVMRRSRYPVLASNPLGLDSSELTPHLEMGRILVPLDGSEHSADVLPLVIELARVYDSAVTLLHVIEPVLAAPSISPIEADLLLEPFRMRLVEAGIPVRARSVTGPAASSILDVARLEKSDLLALTTHGRSGLSRLVFGSVAEAVLRRSPCPVVVKRMLGTGTD